MTPFASVAAVAWPPIALGWRRAALNAWIVAMSVVALFSLHSGLGPPSGFGMDKLFHCLGYLVLALLPQGAFETRRAALLAALAMIPFGIALEFAQDIVPGRMADPWDAVANSVGAIVGIVLALPVRRLVAHALPRVGGLDRLS